MKSIAGLFIEHSHTRHFQFEILLHVFFLLFIYTHSSQYMSLSVFKLLFFLHFTTIQMLLIQHSIILYTNVMHPYVYVYNIIIYCVELRFNAKLLSMWFNLFIVAHGRRRSTNVAAQQIYIQQVPIIQLLSLTKMHIKSIAHFIVGIHKNM